MERLVRRFERLSTGPKLLLGALLTTIPFYFAAVLSYWVANVAKLEDPLVLGLHAVVFVGLFTVVVFVIRFAAAVRAQMQAIEQQRLELRLHAYAYIDRLVSSDLKKLHDDPEMETLLAGFGASTTALQDVVEAAYHAFESEFGKSTDSKNRTDFEVTFMTRSYRDHNITIPACANRDGRAPRSMVLRRERADIYDATVTAAIYREARPSVRIIEDTGEARYDYQELYPNQTRRIQSSIVFPVFSDANELLGTLVVHCDHRRFFRWEDEKYWCDLLEIFAKRIALIKRRLDIVEHLREQGKNLQLQLPVPPF